MLSVERNVPAELIGLLEKGRYSVHIKGAPGSGKTTLALEMVKGISTGDKTVIYLSSRVSPDRLLDQFPWIGECLNERNILDARRSYLSSDLPRSAIFEYTEQPEFLRSINDRIQQSEKRPVTVIIDSLDAIKTNMNIPLGDTTLESILLELGAKTNTNMIFVSEASENQRLDYLTDAVVRLERGIVKDRLVRKLYLEKLRGGEIKQPFYLFSLKNGRFTIFEPINFPHIKYAPPKLEKSGESMFISTSIQELDKILNGGLRKSTLNLLEVAKGIGTEYVYFLWPIVLSFIRQEIPAFINLPQTATTKLAMEYLSSTVGLGNDEKILSLIRKYLHFLVLTEEAESELNEISVSKDNIQEFILDFRNAVTEVTKRLGAETFLWLLGVDTLERIFGEEALRRNIGAIVLETGYMKGIILAMARQGIQCIDSLRHLSSTNFVMERIGTTVIYGEFPPTEMYALVIENVNGNNEVSLRSIL